MSFEVYDNKEGKVIGYLNVDFHEFFIDVHKSLSQERLPAAWFKIYDEYNVVSGRIEIEAHMLLAEEAEENPVGDGRSAPNKDPPLHAPSNGRDLEDIENEINTIKKTKESGTKKYKKYIALMCCIIILVAVPVSVSNIH